MGSADVAPVLQRRGAEVLAGFAPFLLHAVEGRHDYQDHERNLEIEIGEGEPPEAVQVEARVVELMPKTVLQEHGDESHPPEGRYEGEGQGHAGEVGCHSGERRHEATHGLWQAAQGHPVRDEEAEDPAAERR